MSVKIEKTEKKDELKLTFNVEAEKFEKAIEKVYAKNIKYFNIPGFRKGKAPLNIVEKYYGVEVFYEDAFNEIASEEFEKEIKENNVEMIGRPQVDIVQIGKGKELIFTAIIETKPNVEVKNYKGIEIKKIEYNVKEEDIENELKQMAEKNSRMITIEDKAVEDGNIVNIDFEGFLDGVAFDGGKGEQFDLTIGSKTFIPGFEEQIVGMNINEEKDIKVTFPEDYNAENLAGKETTFKVKVNGIKEKQLPEIDEEFVKDVSEYNTLKELKDSIKEKLEDENAHRAKHETEDAVLKVLSDSVEIEIPQPMIETEIDNIVADMENRMSYQGLKLEQYLGMINKSMEEFRKEFEEQAKSSVKLRLIIESVVKQEKVEVKDEEISEKLKEMAEMYGRDEKELSQNIELKKYIENSIKNDKAVNIIVENAKIK